MATVTVSRQFAEDFKEWADYKISVGDFSQEEMAELKQLIRIDLGPGTDQLRKDYTVLNAKGVEIPAAIDDQQKRVSLWENWFADEANQIRNLLKIAA